MYAVSVVTAGEIFSTVIQRYIADEDKKTSNLITYAKTLGVEKKVREIIGIWM